MSEPPKVIVELRASVPRFVWIAVAVAVVLVAFSFLLMADSVSAYLTRP
mgnify:CR=1